MIRQRKTDQGDGARTKIAIGKTCSHDEHENIAQKLWVISEKMSRIIPLSSHQVQSLAA